MATVIYPQSKGLEDLSRLANIGIGISGAYQNYKNRLVNEAQMDRSLGLLERAKQRMGQPSMYDYQPEEQGFLSKLFGSEQPKVTDQQREEQVKLAQLGAGLLDPKTNEMRIDLAGEMEKEIPDQKKINKVVGDINKNWTRDEKLLSKYEERQKQKELEIPTEWGSKKAIEKLVTNFNDPRGLHHQMQENLYNLTLKNLEGKDIVQQYNTVLKAKRTAYGGDVEGQTRYAQNYDLLLSELRGRMKTGRGRGGDEKGKYVNLDTGDRADRRSVVADPKNPGKLLPGWTWSGSETETTKINQLQKRVNNFDLPEKARIEAQQQIDIFEGKYTREDIKKANKMTSELKSAFKGMDFFEKPKAAGNKINKYRKFY